MFASHIPSKGLISRTQKEFSKHNNRKTTQRKGRIWIDSLPWKMWMTHKLIKRCLATLVHQGHIDETHNGYHHPGLEWPKENMQTTHSAGNCSAGGAANATAPLGNCSHSYPGKNVQLAEDPTIPLVGIHPGEMNPGPPETWTRMFTAALNWSHPKCPPGECTPWKTGPSRGGYPLHPCTQTTRKCQVKEARLKSCVMYDSIYVTFSQRWRKT